MLCIERIYNIIQKAFIIQWTKYFPLQTSLSVYSTFEMFTSECPEEWEC